MIGTADIVRQPPATYVDYYRFTEAPFTLTPNPRFVYLSRSYLQALDEITHALERREGLVVLTGEIGTGKTTLCRTLLEHLPRRTFLSLVLNPFLTGDDLMRQLLRDFGVISEETARKREGTRVTPHELVSALQQFLASLIPLDAHAVIMIDEAQHLDPHVLEHIRLLSNFETDTAKLLQIILVGQPDLNDLLKRSDLRQLDQRVARRCRLESLTPEEVGHYIERRLWVAHGFSSMMAGGAGPSASQVDETSASGMWRARFAPAAVSMVAKLSKGTPRVINLLCDRALEVGAEREQAIIDRQAVLEGARRLQLSGATPHPLSTLVRREVVIAVLVLAGLVGALRWFWPSRAAQSAAPVTQTTTTQRVQPDSPAQPGSPALAAQSGSPPARPASPAPPASSPPGASTVPLKVADSYLVVAAAFKSVQKTNAVTTELGRAGLPTFNRLDSTGIWHLVLVGPYVSRDEAVAAQRQLAALDYGDAHIIVDRPATSAGVR